MGLTDYQIADAWPKLRAQFKKWEPDNEDYKLWAERMAEGPFDVFDFDKARKQHKVDRGTFHEPVLKDLLKLAAGYARASGQQASAQGVEGHYFMVCTSKDNNGLGPVGSCIPLSFFWSEQWRKCPWERFCQAEALIMRKAYGGGRWSIVVQDEHEDYWPAYQRAMSLARNPEEFNPNRLMEQANENDPVPF